MAGSEDSQNQANEIVTLRNVALYDKLTFFTLSLRRKRPVLRGKERCTLDMLDVQRLDTLHDTCFL